jgi:hypothetical protein
VTLAASVVYAGAFVLLAVAAVVMLYGGLGSSRTMVWTSVGLSAAAASAAVVSLYLGRR